MAFFQNIKKLFGFGTDFDDEEIDGIDATVVPLSMRESSEKEESSTVSEDTVEENCIETPDSNPFAEIQVDLIFSHVVETFNKALPDFLSKSIDPEKERKVLYESLSTSVKEQIEAAAVAVSRQKAERWQIERSRMLEEINNLKERHRKNEENESELKTRHLSEQRQKRALNERIHDLESQITALQAEHEQYELENKSLLNKLRLTTVLEGDSQPSADAAEKILALTDENKSLNTMIDELKKKQELSDAMIKDFNSIASAAKRDLKERDEEIERLKASSSDDADNLRDQIQQLQTRLEEAETSLNNKSELLNEKSALLEQTAKELEEANENLKVAEMIQEQIEKFEELKKRKDAKINELQTARTSLIERMRLLEEENITLKNNIEQLQKQFDEQQTLSALNTTSGLIANEPIETVYASETTFAEKSNSSDENESTAQKTVIISAIDPSLDNTDWLIATPPEGSSARDKFKTESDEQFGYQAPAIRKTPPENEAQMTLW